MCDIILVGLVIYAIIECMAFIMIIGLTVSSQYDENQISLKQYISTLADDLFFDTTYNFPLARVKIEEYTLFGKILFTSIWILILGVPFICGVILSYFILLIWYLIKKTCYKQKH